MLYSHSKSVVVTVCVCEKISSTNCAKKRKMKCGGSLVRVIEDVNIIDINVIKFKQLKKINAHFQIIFSIFSHSIFKKFPFLKTVFYFIFLVYSI